MSVSLVPDSGYAMSYAVLSLATSLNPSHRLGARQGDLNEETIQHIRVMVIVAPRCKRRQDKRYWSLQWMKDRLRVTGEETV